jgi:glycosyltransferase involved in cell wall biosynthesis
MKELADELLPKNILYNFLGFLPTNEVYLYYKNKPIDVFLNVSASEGLPVSIMEAQSCGIPVIATAVGGTPEIVNEKVGILLSPNPTPEEIGSTIEYLIDNSEIAKQMRYSSIKIGRSDSMLVKIFLNLSILSKDLTNGFLKIF